MADAVEALFISTGSEDNTTCSVQDLRTGTDLMRYKGGGIAQHHGLAMISLSHVFAANSAKPLIHVWPINKQEQMASLRFVVPGKVNALALTPDGCFLAAGIQENIYLWHMNTGRMLNTLSKHYQAITCLRFTDNGEHFISGGKDGAVLVWDLTFAAAPLDTGSSGQDSTEPLYSFNDHGLAVTDVYSGLGGIRSHLFTVSLDRCCNIYDLLGGSQLLSVVFPVALHSVIVNRLETHVYVGSGDGKVYVFHMEKTPRMKEYHVEEDELQAFVGHTAGKAITSLALNMSSTSLVSGGEDNQVCVWDVGSRQLIKSLPQTGSVTNLCIRLLTPSVFLPEHKHTQPFADTLKRMITPRTKDDYIELLVTEEYAKGRKSPEPDLTECYPGTDTEILRKLIASMYMSKSQKDKDEGEAEEEEQDELEAEDESDAEEDEMEVEDEAANEELSRDDVQVEGEDEEDDVEADEEEEEAEEEEDEDADPDESMENSASANGVDVQKLLEENARLKEESKRLFDIVFQYISTSNSSSAKPGDSAIKTKRKKPSQN
ncbi:WD repeat-containing protein 18 [Drosophila kikkawai]|uniref:WD repeat-containing protein 18 n=1 Tax=Drosophila kikkawai TaxID=30033 RepID=A0A6P4J1I2_DROKI|nr:WD repeat-containing protein 18 [Drosophila kikkawai]